MKDKEILQRVELVYCDLAPGDHEEIYTEVVRLLQLQNALVMVGMKIPALRIKRAIDVLLDQESEIPRPSLQNS